VRVISHKGNTIAAKIVVKLGDSESISLDTFWPDGVHARKWINKESVNDIDVVQQLDHSIP